MWKDDVAPRVAMLMEYFYTGSGVGLWGIGEDGEVFYTSNQNAKELEMILKSGDCLKYALEEASDLQVPFIMGDSLGMIWVGEYAAITENLRKMLVLLGPVFLSSASEKGIADSLKGAGVSVELRRKSMRILQDIPVIQYPVLQQYVKMLHYAITNHNLDPNEIVIQYTTVQKEEEHETEHSFTDYEREKNREDTLLQCIRQGNRNYHKILEETVQISDYSLGIETPLREAKDIVIIFAAVCIRAAVSGGVSRKEMREMEKDYIHEIEGCTRITDLAEIRHRIMDECVEAVCRIQEQGNISKPIQACCDYIKAHFNEPIDLKKIAKSVGYTEYYLTKRFQKEMGIKLLDYIKKVRISYAKVWLITNEKSIQEISEILQFTSRNYFTKVFKAQEGMTPAEYRERAVQAGKGSGKNAGAEREMEESR